MTMKIQRLYLIEFTKEERVIMRELGWQLSAGELALNQSQYERMCREIKEAYRIYSDEETWKTKVIRRIYAYLLRL